MEQGTVKWFDEEKRYGFIRSDVGGKDYFAHITDVEDIGRSLEKGERVEFEIAQTERGLKATNIRLLQEESTL